MRSRGSRVWRGVRPFESGLQKGTGACRQGGKRAGSRDSKGVTEKLRSAEGVQAERRAGGATVALAVASQTQGSRVLFGFQSEIGDAGVLAGSLGGSGSRHY